MIDVLLLIGLLFGLWVYGRCPQSEWGVKPVVKGFRSDNEFGFRKSLVPGTDSFKSHVDGLSIGR